MRCVLTDVRMAMESCWNVLTRKSPGDEVLKMTQVAEANRLAGGQEETPHTQLGEEGTQPASGDDSDYGSDGYNTG